MWSRGDIIKVAQHEIVKRRAEESIFLDKSNGLWNTPSRMRALKYKRGETQ